MTRTLVINDWLPEPLANVHADHWRKRERKLEAARVMVWAAGKHDGLEPVTGRAAVTITLVFAVQRRRDADNLYARCKGLLDGLVRGKWITDDSTDVIDLIVRSEIGARKRTIIELAPEGTPSARMAGSREDSRT